MNYHIMIQDKFIDGFIQDVYDINEQDNNQFWVRSSEQEAHHINSKYPLQYIGNNKQSITSFLSKISKEDIIFVHWYDTFIAGLLYDLPNKIVVFFWGGELYEDPFWYHYNWLYDKQTKAYVRKANTPELNLRKNVFKLSKNMLEIIKYKLKVPTDGELFKQKLKQIQRIDYLLITEQNIAEVELLRKLYPGTKFETGSIFYDVNYNLAADYKRNNVNEKIKILLGNSATESNNHLEAFDLLKGMDVDIYCPLSYGGEHYRNLIVQKGKELFGNRFHPVTTFMERKAYIDFLAQMDVVLMYHNRSQAWGNIATSLTLGKPVFLKSKNPLGKFINALQLQYYEADTIKDHNLRELIDIEYQRRKDNLALLKKNLSKEKRQADMKKFFDKMKKICVL